MQMNFAVSKSEKLRLHTERLGTICPSANFARIGFCANATVSITKPALFTVEIILDLLLEELPFSPRPFSRRLRYC